MIGMAPRVVIVITLRANMKLKSRYWGQLQKTSLWIFGISWLPNVFLLLIMSNGTVNSVLFKIWFCTQIKVKDWDQAFFIWMFIKGYVLVVVICGQLGWVMSWTLFEQMETKYTSALSINTGQHTHTIPKIAKEIRLPDCLWENGFIWRAVKNCSGPSAAVPCDQHGPPRPWLSSWSRSLWSSCIEMAEKETICRDQLDGLSSRQITWGFNVVWRRRSRASPLSSSPGDCHG